MACVADTHDRGALLDGTWYYASCCATSVKGTGCAVNVLRPVHAPASGQCGAVATVSNSTAAYLLMCTGWIGAVGPV